VSDELKSAFMQVLIDHVSTENYPSSTMMDLIEQHLDDPQLRAEYVAALIDRLATDRFPSMSMARRVRALVT
jgi:hypothetical protein